MNDRFSRIAHSVVTPVVIPAISGNKNSSNQNNFVVPRAEVHPAPRVEAGMQGFYRPFPGAPPAITPLKFLFSFISL